MTEDRDGAGFSGASQGNESFPRHYVNELLTSTERISAKALAVAFELMAADRGILKDMLSATCERLQVREDCLSKARQDAAAVSMRLQGLLRFVSESQLPRAHQGVVGAVRFRNDLRDGLAVVLQAAVYASRRGDPQEAGEQEQEAIHVGFTKSVDATPRPPRRPRRTQKKAKPSKPRRARKR